MTIFILLILSMVIILIYVLTLPKIPKNRLSDTNDASIVDPRKQLEDGTSNKQKIMNVFNELEDGRVTNNDIEKILTVSDDTATHHLEELEKEGKIQQYGPEGSNVYYQKPQKNQPIEPSEDDEYIF